VAEVEVPLPAADEVIEDLFNDNGEVVNDTAETVIDLLEDEFGKFTSIPVLSIGLVIMNTINNTSITSTSGVTLISEFNFALLLMLNYFKVYFSK
jgi:hypothetical protein